MPMLQEDHLRAEDVTDGHMVGECTARWETAMERPGHKHDFVTVDEDQEHRIESNDATGVGNWLISTESPAGRQGGTREVGR